MELKFTFTAAASLLCSGGKSERLWPRGFFFSPAALFHPNTLRYRFSSFSSPQSSSSSLFPLLRYSSERLMEQRCEGLILAQSQGGQKGRQWATDYGDVVFVGLSGLGFDEPPDTQQEAAEWTARRKVLFSRLSLLRLLNSFEDTKCRINGAETFWESFFLDPSVLLLAKDSYTVHIVFSLTWARFPFRWFLSVTESLD